MVHSSQAVGHTDPNREVVQSKVGHRKEMAGHNTEVFWAAVQNDPSQAEDQTDHHSDALDLPRVQPVLQLLMRYRFDWFQILAPMALHAVAGNRASVVAQNPEAGKNKVKLQVRQAFLPFRSWDTAVVDSLGFDKHKVKL